MQKTSYQTGRLVWTSASLTSCVSFSSVETDLFPQQSHVGIVLRDVQEEVVQVELADSSEE